MRLLHLWFAMTIQFNLILLKPYISLNGSKFFYFLVFTADLIAFSTILQS
jgi:hypothetical protein